MMSRPAHGLPHPFGIVGALAGSAVALAPGSLPRDTTVHLAVVSMSLLLGAGIGSTIGRVAHRRRWSRRTRVWTIGVAAIAFTVLVVADTAWQARLRSDLDMPRLGIGWVTASLGPVVVYALLVVAPRVTLIAVATVAATAVGLAPAVAGPQVGTSRAAAFETTGATEASLRLYSSVGDGPLTHRADTLVDDWAAAGGARRGAVVVAVPTGSGWVDPDAVRGFEERFDGDVAVIALQYDDIPSWQAFVSGTDSARSSAVAVTSALLHTVERLPVGRRPQVYLYGQSLGAIGADAARAWATRTHAPICGTVLAGPPADSVARNAPDRVVLANASDPVVRWSPSLIWQPPTRWPGHPDLPRPMWLPVASFVQASADLLGALSFAAGHGHQYGTEQGTAAPPCTRR